MMFLLAVYSGISFAEGAITVPRRTNVTVLAVSMADANVKSYLWRLQSKLLCGYIPTGSGKPRISGEKPVDAEVLHRVSQTESRGANKGLRKVWRRVRDSPQPFQPSLVFATDIVNLSHNRRSLLD